VYGRDILLAKVPHVEGLAGAPICTRGPGGGPERPGSPHL